MKMKLFLKTAFVVSAMVAYQLVVAQVGVVQVRPPGRPSAVDLSRFQTPVKNQGGRTTCITFAALAALEAAYNRAGYGSINLSEQFLNHIGKTFWLHPQWREIEAKGPDGGETQVGAFGGGGGVGYIVGLASGLKVPTELVAMPYRNTDYIESDFGPLAYAWNSPYWNQQKRMSDFNLNRRFLPQSALVAERYYSVRSFKKINARSPIEVEQVLAGGKEVVWDFAGVSSSFPIWNTSSGPRSLGHAMLIIGYNRSDPDPTKHYFLVKNSWGPTAHPGGYERISYEYLRQYGIAAAYIEAINPPGRWYELAFVGRWALNFDGHKGILDIYHLPRLSESYLLADYGVTTRDNRLGTFYDATGKAYKVNGIITGASIRFYLDSDNPNARWDALRGRHFMYTLLSDKSEIMAGRHQDLDGKVYGGFARKDGIYQQTVPLTGVIGYTSYIGKWNIQFNNKIGTLEILRHDRSNTSLPGYDAMVGSTKIGRDTYSTTVFIERANPSRILIHIPGLIGAPVWEGGGQINASLLNHDSGNIAGTVLTAGGHQFGFLMSRTTQVIKIL
jgi:Papain family cysteine protease